MRTASSLTTDLQKDCKKRVPSTTLRDGDKTALCIWNLAFGQLRSLEKPKTLSHAEKSLMLNAKC